MRANDIPTITFTLADGGRIDWRVGAPRVTRYYPDGSENDVEAVLCPTCYADAGRPCETPSVEVAAATHQRRVRKAQSIARDLAVAGCLPEHDSEGYRVAMATEKASPRNGGGR